LTLDDFVYPDRPEHMTLMLLSQRAALAHSGDYLALYIVAMVFAFIGRESRTMSYAHGIKLT